MLFVDNDQPKIRHRCEYGKPRAEYDACAALLCGFPMTRACRLGQLTVQTDQAGIGKAGRDAFFQLRREIDLGDQHQRRPPGRQHALDQAQIDLRFTAAGHAVQQVSVKTLPVGLDAFEYLRLFAGQFRRRCRCFRRRNTSALARFGWVDAAQARRQG